MKRGLLLLLAFVILLSGCSGIEQTENTTVHTMAETEPKTTEPAEPEQESNKLTVGIVKSAYVTDYADNAYTKYLQEQTGLELEFFYFSSSSGNHAGQLATMVEGNIELPDVIMDVPLERDVCEQYGTDGIFLNLAPYFNDRTMSGDWWARFEQLPEEMQTAVLEAMTCDGAIYGFPSVQMGPDQVMDYQVMINRQWLETLKLDAPTDPESLYHVLKAFKEGDPNGNGEADEIPLLGTTERGGDVLSWIMNMFLYYDDQAVTYADENGAAYEPATTDTYREALRYLRKLYAEELLSPLSLTDNNIDTQTFIEADKTGIVCGNVLECFQFGSEKISSYEVLPLWGYGVRNSGSYHISTYITRDCKNVDGAWKLLMAMSTEKSALIQRYGPEALFWEHTENGILLHEDTWTDPQHRNHWQTVVATILPDMTVETTDLRYALLRTMWECYTTQDAARTFELWGESELVALRRKHLLNFTTGKWDIEKDDRWQRCIEEIQALQ